MTEKKIWIVTELFYPEETAVAFIFTRIANYLSNNYKVCVICGPEFYDYDKKQFTDVIGISNEIEIYRIKSFNFDKNSLLQRSLKILILSLQMGVLMCKKISKGETVILSTNPAPLLLSVRLIKLFKKNHIHILVHDVFPENAIPAKVFKDNKAITFKVIKFLFDRAYSSADHIIVIGRDMKNIIYNKISHFKNKPPISIVPNWSNPEKHSLVNYSLKKENKLILQYAGNIGRVQGIMEILEAFRLSKNKGIFLSLHGTGALYSHIENYLKKFNLGNIELKGGFSRNEEIEILANCDIGIVSLSEGMFGLGVPSKAYHLLSAGKPILYIGEPNTEIYYMVLEKSIGWVLDIRNQAELIEFFDNISSIESDTLMDMGNRARILAEYEYSEPTILKLLQSKIESISNT
jgi:hypothetical protein